MRLWSKYFGKDTKAVDFAGRTIAKGAYNDRNSKFGWNVDHILPQSKGGATADYNLVCCHIKTNDEKADIFPCFKANGIAFEIVKVQNHYEIRQKSKEEKQPKAVQKAIDFYDSAAGVRCIRQLKDVQDKECSVGSVLVVLQNIENTAVVDFIKEIFSEENISVVKFYEQSYQNITKSIRRQNIQVKIRNYDMSQKENIVELLDKCVLLNTYLSSYFLERKDISGFDIYYRIDRFDNKSQIYGSDFKGSCCSGQTNNSMFVNELVFIYTETGKKTEKKPDTGYTEYNCVYKNLSENLKKEVSGK